MDTNCSAPDDDEIAVLCDDGDARVRRLAQEVKRLRDGIRQHQSNTGHSVCWLNDLELWQLLAADARYPHQTLPVREEFLANCKRFYNSRLEGTPWEDPPVKQTITDADRD